MSESIAEDVAETEAASAEAVENAEASAEAAVIAASAAQVAADAASAAEEQARENAQRDADNQVARRIGEYETRIGGVEEACRTMMTMMEEHRTSLAALQSSIPSMRAVEEAATEATIDTLTEVLGTGDAGQDVPEGAETVEETIAPPAEPVPVVARRVVRRRFI